MSKPLGYAPHLRALAPVLAGVKAGRLHHANLWTGPDGVGKFMWLQGVARYALCMAQDALFGEPCECMSCKSFDVHPDFLVVGPDPAELKIEPMRELVHKCTLKPMLSNLRVVAIRDAHEMTPQAQNALLKTLEEPPGHTLFFVLTHQERALLRTIRSRCQHVRFAPLDAVSLGRIFAEKLPPEPVASTLINASAGSGAQLLRLAEAAKRDDVMSQPLAPLLKAPVRDKLAAAEVLAETYETTVTAAMRFAEQLTSWAREGQPGQRKRAVELFDDLNALLSAVEGNGNRKLLWEKWLLSV